MGAIGAVPQGLGVVEGGAIPYKPEALATRAENRAKWIERDPERKCYLPGLPRANYMQFPFEIVQSKSQLLFSYQYAGAVRHVFLKDPGPAQLDSWMGQSVGKWEGGSLVITVTAQNDHAARRQPAQPDRLPDEADPGRRSLGRRGGLGFSRSDSQGARQRGDDRHALQGLQRHHQAHRGATGAGGAAAWPSGAARPATSTSPLGILMSMKLPPGRPSRSGWSGR